MKSGLFLKLFLGVFAAGCGVVVWQTGIFSQDRQSANGGIIPLAAEIQENKDAVAVEKVEAAEAASSPKVEAEPLTNLSAVSGSFQTVVLGEVYDKIARTGDMDRYKFKVELTTLGAAVKTAELSEFSDLDPTEPKPLSIVNPADSGKLAYSLACESLYVTPKGRAFAGYAFPLNKLNWQLAEQGGGKAVFVAEMGDVKIVDGKQQLSTPVLRLTRTYLVVPGSYDLVSDMKIENLSSQDIRVQMNVAGPAGIPHEGQQRDTLTVFCGFGNAKGEVESQTIDLNKMKKAVDGGAFDKLKVGPAKDPSSFLWAAISNKYFAAIAYPSTDQSKGVIAFDTARYYAGRPEVRHSENCSFVMKAGAFELSAAGTEKSSQSFAINVYFGPKDKNLFENNPIYNKLGFFHVISFQSCCCPAFMIGPLAFGIVWLMNTLYHLMGPLGNYGIVIMIFVFLIRLILHPMTKSGQVQMMKMQKLSPKIQEMQKKLKQHQKMDPEMMALNKELMRSQMMGMLPMFLQMPIWIALWTAVYMNVDLRGQGFLPFWITDLSGPDALLRFRPFNIPMMGEISSLNILPLLMGGVMYLQMKLTPQAQTAQTSPEMAQQQKIMSVMMVAMFPIMLYNGPSGVNLYIMSSIAAGVVEQMVIRKHIKEKQEQEEANLVPTTAKIGKVKKKKPKPLFRFDK